MKRIRVFWLTAVFTLILATLSTTLVTAKNWTTVEAATPTIANWTQATRSGDIVYFLFNDPIKIERYNITTESWLSPLTFNELLGTPTAFAVDESYLYVGFDRALYRFNKNGTGQLHLYNTDATIREIYTDTQYVFVNYSSGNYGKVASINKSSGVFIDSNDSLYHVINGGTYSPVAGKIFARTSGISPSDIFQVIVNSDGTFGAVSDSPYHGDYPRATKTFLFPDGSRVVDSAGIIYNTSDLTYNNSLIGAVDDLVFYGDLPVVLRNGSLHSFSNTMLETGDYTPDDHTPQRIFMQNDIIFSFYYEATRGVTVSTIDIDLLEPDTPGEPIDPNGLLYTPDDIELGNNDIIYLLSKTHLSIFRWSVESKSYLETIPLAAAPSHMAYSPITNRLYLTYSTGAIKQIKLNESLDETPFANLPSAARGLATAGEYVFAVDPSGAWVSHYTFHPDGTQISAVEWNYRSNDFQWSVPHRKMYFFRDDTSPNDLLWEDIAVDGTIGTKKDSPYHGNAGISHPIRLAPDGSTVLLGSGLFYDPISLEQTGSLANSIEEAAWISGTLYTLRDIGVDIQVQRWSSNYALEDATTTPGETLRFFRVDEGLLAIIDFYGLTRFVLLDDNLDELYASETLSGLTASSNSPTYYGNTTTFSSEIELGAGNLTYLWNFGDGASQVGSPSSHVYSTLGEFDVVLTVSNEAEAISTTTTVSIIDRPISGLNAANDGPTAVGDSTRLSGSVGQGTNVVYSWDLGDGSSATGKVIDYTYPAIGTYTATLTAVNSVSSQVATTVIEVTELVTPVIGLSPDSLEFTVQRGRSLLDTKQFGIENTGSGTLDWAVSESLSWVSVNRTSGSGAAQIAVTVNGAGLSVGAHNGLIRVSDPDATNSPQYVAVKLTVLPQEEIDLSVASGYTAVQLQWNAYTHPQLAGYRIYRSNEGEDNWSVIDTTTKTFYFDDSPELLVGETYCYGVAAISGAGATLAESSAKCVEFGGTALLIPTVYAVPGTEAVVPVRIGNAQGLQIAAGDIWIEYDSSVITFKDVSSTPMTADYIWSYQDEAISGNVRRVKIGTFNLEPNVLYGSGALFWLTFDVIGESGDSSAIDLREFISGVGGSTIYTPDNLSMPIALTLDDGVLEVGEGYALGDLNGNGVVETVDAYIALQIAIDKIVPSAAQEAAGDVNGNGRIDTADATMIFHFAVHGEWPTVIEPLAVVQRSVSDAVTLSLSNAKGDAGDEIVLTLKGTNLTNWAGGEFSIVYDAAMVDSIASVDGVGLGNDFVVDYNDDGVGSVQIAMMANTAVSGSGNLIQITLRLNKVATNGTTSNVAIASAQLNDLAGRDFETSALQTEIAEESGTITVEGIKLFLPLLSK